MDINGLLKTKIVGQLFLHFFKKKLSEKWLTLAIMDRAKSKYPFPPIQTNCCHSTLKKIVLESQNRGACFCLASAFQKMFYERQKGPLMPHLDIPTLLIWGKNDKTHRRTDRLPLISYQ